MIYDYSSFFNVQYKQMIRIKC